MRWKSTIPPSSTCMAWVDLPYPRSSNSLIAATLVASLSALVANLINSVTAAPACARASDLISTVTLLGVPFCRPPVLGDPFDFAILFQSIFDCRDAGLEHQTGS